MVQRIGAIGLHFFSPVERMPLVAVVRGQATAQATVREALALVERIGQGRAAWRVYPSQRAM